MFDCFVFANTQIHIRRFPDNIALRSTLRNLLHLPKKKV
jgi:hypothetical protein